MTYETCVTIILTALCAMLAALALGIGALAIWGYKGIQEVVTKKATSSAEKALAAKMKEYPDAAQLLNVTQRLTEHLDAMQLLRDQMGNAVPNVIAQASNLGQDELTGKPTDSIAADYPSDGR